MRATVYTARARFRERAAAASPSPDGLLGTGAVAVAPVRYPLDLTGTLRALLRPAAVRSQSLRGTLAGSGEDALVLAFRCLVDGSRLVPGDAVVLPDFVCSSVPRAIERAGLRAVFAPLDPAHWGFVQGALEADVRAFVAVSYFGLPPGGDAAARAQLGDPVRRAVAVEDLAQAYGIAPQARLAGAQAAVFSFGRGKSLPLAWGGLVEMADADLAARVARHAEGHARASVLGDALHLFAAQALRAVLHPAVWRFVALPGGQTAPPPEPRHRAPGPTVGAYLAAADARHQRIVAQRRRNALALRGALESLAGHGLTLPDEAALRAGVALRMPVVFDDPRVASGVRSALAERAIVKGPNAWDDYGRATPNAAAIASRLVTLPTQPGSEAAAERAIALVARALRPRATLRTPAA